MDIRKLWADAYKIDWELSSLITTGNCSVFWIAESRKRVKEEAEAAKYQAEKARAAKKIESEDELLEQDEEESSTKKKSKRSQVWPWENPGVESEDEVWIDGNIKPDEIGVHRLDITKGRKKNANGVQESEGITIMSQKMQRKRDLEDPRYNNLLI